MAVKPSCDNTPAYTENVKASGIERVAAVVADNPDICCRHTCSSLVTPPQNEVSARRRPRHSVRTALRHVGPTEAAGYQRPSRSTNFSALPERT
jgi:hypothetical protein